MGQNQVSFINREMPFFEGVQYGGGGGLSPVGQNFSCLHLCVLVWCQILEPTVKDASQNSLNAHACQLGE